MGGTMFSSCRTAEVHLKRKCPSLSPVALCGDHSCCINNFLYIFLQIRWIWFGYEAENLHIDPCFGFLKVQKPKARLLHWTCALLCASGSESTQSTFCCTTFFLPSYPGLCFMTSDLFCGPLVGKDSDCHELLICCKFVKLWIILECINVGIFGPVTQTSAYEMLYCNCRHKGLYQWKLHFKCVCKFITVCVCVCCRARVISVCMHLLCFFYCFQAQKPSTTDQRSRLFI